MERRIRAVLHSATHRTDRDRCGGQGGPGPPMSARPARSATAGQLALELPLELPADRHRARVEGPAAAVGPRLPPDVLVPRELPGGPRPTPSSPATRGPATSSSTRSPAAARPPLQACAEGRIGVGNDLNPFAHLLTAAKVEPRDAAPQARDPARAAPPRLERRRRPAGWRSAQRVVADPATRTPLVPRPARARRPTTASSRSRPRSRSPSTRGRSASSCSSGRRSDLDDRTDRFLAAAITGHPPRQERELPVRADAQHVLAWRRATSATSPRGPAFASPERDVFDGLGDEARPALPPAAAVDRGHRAARRRPRRRAARPGRPARPRPARPGPARGHLAALPAGRQVRLLQLAADVVPRASTRGRSTRRSTTPTTASRTSRSCARSSPACARSSTDDAVVVLVIGDVETDRGRRIRGGVGLAERVWEAAAEPEGYRLAGRRPRRRRRRPQDDQAVGRRGRAGDEDRPDPRPGRDRGRPPPRARRARRSTSTGPGRRAAARALTDTSGKRGQSAVVIRVALPSALARLRVRCVGDAVGWGARSRHPALSVRPARSARPRRAGGRRPGGCAAPTLRVRAQRSRALARHHLRRRRAGGHVPGHPSRAGGRPSPTSRSTVGRPASSSSRTSRSPMARSWTIGPCLAIRPGRACPRAVGLERSRSSRPTAGAVGGSSGASRSA